MKPEVLVINLPAVQKLKINADYVDETSKVKNWNYSVVIFNEVDADQKFLDRLLNESPHSQKIVVVKSLDFSKLKTINDANALNFVVNQSELDQLESLIDKAASRTTDAPAEATEVSQKRAQKRIENINHQIEALHKALMAVHSAESVSEVETLLYSALHETLDLSWVRVFLHSSEHLDDQLKRIQGQALFKASLLISARHLGRIVFARKTAKAFTKSEEESLKQISESVALALDRLAKLDLAETLKQQWDSTFDAVSEPLCLTDEKFKIIRTNQAFLKTTGIKPSQVIGLNCFSAFCGKSAPTDPVATVAPSPNSLILQRQQKSGDEPRTYEVTTQRILVNDQSPSILMIIFRDITEQKKIEKQIFESSKMAELGTIGSSIAHDINNPLGGMLNFLQLIKMDLKKDNPIYEDIIEMENAGHRCKEIVENLLNFTRRHEANTAEPVDLSEVIDQALKIIELQTRSLGVQVEVKKPEKARKILGHFNLLAQALSHVLQNAFEAVSEKLSRNPGYKGHIDVEISDAHEGLILTIKDNGVGISPELQNKILNPLFSTKSKGRNQGLGLTLAYQIIDDHSGRLEIFSQPNVGTTVKISFINV